MADSTADRQAKLREQLDAQRDAPPRAGQQKAPPSTDFLSEDLGAAARKKSGAPEPSATPDPNAPKRADFPEGLGGTAAYNKARNDYNAKSPQKRATKGLLK